MCSLPECPPIYTADHAYLKDTDGWNVWSASCAMITSGDTFHNVALGKTVKIKKSASMVGELVIDRGSDTSGSSNRHFGVDNTGTLEMEDVTLKGGYAVSSFCSFCIVMKYSCFDGDLEYRIYSATDKKSIYLFYLYLFCLFL